LTSLNLRQLLARRGPLRASLLGSAVVQALGVVTGVLLARGLGPTDRGAFAAMVLWPTVMVTLGDLGLVQSFAYFTARGPVSINAMLRLARRSSLLQTLYLLPLTVLVAWVGLEAAGAAPIAAGLLLAAGFVPASLLSRYVAAIFQGRLRMGGFYAVRLSMHLVIAAVLIVISAVGAMSVWSVVYAYLAGLLVMVAVSLVLPERMGTGDSDSGVGPNPLPFTTKQFLGFGLRALPGSLYPVEGLFLDQLIVGVFLGPRELGLYVAALAFTSVPRLMASAIGLTALPTLATTRPSRYVPATARFLGLTVAALTPVAIALVLLMPVLLPGFFGSDFEGAVTSAQLLIVGSLLFGIRQVLGQCLRGAGLPGVVSVVETASWPLIVAAAASGTALGLTGVVGALVVVQAVTLIALIAAGAISHRRVHPPQIHNEPA
jgi:O-antigen/teichoic acid export membrane protein